MKRLRHIDERLERWAAWLESGGGSLAVATFARQARVDCARPDTDRALRDDATHAETGRCVTALAVNLREIVMLSYLRGGSVRGLAEALQLDASALCDRLDAIDRVVAGEGTDAAVADAADPASAPGAPPSPGNRRQRRAARGAGQHGWLSRAVQVAAAVGLTRAAVHDALCRADREIARQLAERRRGAALARERASYRVGTHAAVATIEDGQP